MAPTFDGWASRKLVGAAARVSTRASEPRAASAMAEPEPVSEVPKCPTGSRNRVAAGAVACVQAGARGRSWTQQTSSPTQAPQASRARRRCTAPTCGPSPPAQNRTVSERTRHDAGSTRAKWRRLSKAWPVQCEMINRAQMLCHAYRLSSARALTKWLLGRSPHTHVMREAYAERAIAAPRGPSINDCRRRAPHEPRKPAGPPATRHCAVTPTQVAGTPGARPGALGTSEGGGKLGGCVHARSVGRRKEVLTAAPKSEADPPDCFLEGSALCQIPRAGRQRRIPVRVCVHRNAGCSANDRLRKTAPGADSQEQTLCLSGGHTWEFSAEEGRAWRSTRRLQALLAEAGFGRDSPIHEVCPCRSRTRPSLMRAHFV